MRRSSQSERHGDRARPARGQRVRGSVAAVLVRVNLGGYVDGLVADRGILGHPAEAELHWTEGSAGVFTGSSRDIIGRLARRDFVYARLKVFF